MTALIYPTERHHDEMANTHRDLVVTARAGVALGCLEGLDARDRGRESTDRIVIKVRSGGGHCSIMSANFPTFVHLAILSRSWHKNGPDRGAQPILTVRHIFPLGAFDELALLRDLAGGVESLGVSALVLEELPDSELDPVVTLAALVKSVPSIALGIMLSSHSGRAPSVLAKLLSGLDLVSGGRAHLVIGDVRESSGADLLITEEQVDLITKMLTNDVTTVDGPTYRVDRASNTPRFTHSQLDDDKVVIACSLAQLDWIARQNQTISQSLIVLLGRTSWDQDEPAVARILERSVTKFIGALVNVDSDVEASLSFVESIANRFPAMYLRWPSLPSRDDLARCARMV